MRNKPCLWRRNSGNFTVRFGFRVAHAPTGFGASVQIGPATSLDEHAVAALAAWVQEARQILEAMDQRSTNSEDSSIREKRHGKETAEGV